MAAEETKDKDPVRDLWLFAAQHLKTDDLTAFGKLLDTLPAKHQIWSAKLRKSIVSRFANAGKEIWGVDAEVFKSILADMEKKEKEV